MNHAPRRARALAITLHAAPLVGGTAAVAGAVGALLDHDWTAALWAGLAAAWAFTWAIHTCPAPPRVDRGSQAVTLTGGPVDGGTYTIHGATGRDLSDATVHIDGTDYHVTTITHTCYTAEAIR